MLLYAALIILWDYLQTWLVPCICNSIHPLQIEINPPEMACGHPCSSRVITITILKWSHVQSSHPNECICQCTIAYKYILILGDLRAFSWGTLPSPLTLQNHYCIYRVTPRVFSWGTPPSPLTLQNHYCIYRVTPRVFSWGMPPSPLALQIAFVSVLLHYCIYQVTPRVFSWGTPPSPLALQNAFVSVLLHYCIYRVTPRVFRWGTLPNPLTLRNAFVRVLLHNILGDPKSVQLGNTT